MVDQAKNWTIREVLTWTSGFFGRKAVGQPRLEAEVLLGRALRQSRVQLYMNLEQPLLPEELVRYRALIQQRAEGMPTAYLTGEREFMSLTFEVNRQVLIPRPDTEVLVEEALTILQSRPDLPDNLPLRAADIGTGSGNIAVALAVRIPGLEVWGIDVSASALEVAQRNAERHGVGQRVRLLEGDLLQPLMMLQSPPRLDLIAANLPYIPAGDLPHLPREVLQEPLTALDGGKDGLIFYRRLVPLAFELLKPGGVLLLEIGSEQARAAKKIFTDGTWGSLDILKDYAGRDRVVKAVKPAAPDPAPLRRRFIKAAPKDPGGASL